VGGLQFGLFSSVCTPAETNIGLCTSVTESEVILEVNGSTPGSPSDPGTPSDETLWPDNPTPTDPFADCIYALNSRCLVAGPSRTVEVQPVTWADIAAFAPTQGDAGMEPLGWTVTGLETNFYSTSVPHIQEGTLLDRATEVRFTPVGFRWDYGDGTSAHLSTGGATWVQLGVREFDATPTSHVFEASGDYTVVLVVEFAAEYRMEGMPWTPIAGTIDVAAPPLQVSAGSAKTVLVNRECTLNPRGPGC